MYAVELKLVSAGAIDNWNKAKEGRLDSEEHMALAEYFAECAAAARCQAGRRT